MKCRNKSMKKNFMFKIETKKMKFFKNHLKIKQNIWKNAKEKNEKLQKNQNY